MTKTNEVIKKMLSLGRADRVFLVTLTLASTSAFSESYDAGYINDDGEWVPAASTSADSETLTPPAAALEIWESTVQEAKSSPEKFRMLIWSAQWGLCMHGHLTMPFSGKEDERTRAAYSAFAKNKGTKPEKTLSGKLLWQILESVDNVLPDPISLPRFHLMNTGLFVTARGTWQGVEEPISDPLQTTKIECFRRSRICEEATATISEFGFFGKKTLNVHVEQWDVARWDEFEIVSKPNDAICARWALRLNLVNQTVTKTRMRLKADEDCSLIGANDWTLRLVDGDKVERQMSLKHMEEYQQANRLDCGPPPYWD